MENPYFEMKKINFLTVTFMFRFFSFDFDFNLKVLGNPEIQDGGFPFFSSPGRRQKKSKKKKKTFYRVDSACILRFYKSAEFYVRLFCGNLKVYDICIFLYYDYGYKIFKTNN